MKGSTLRLASIVMSVTFVLFSTTGFAAKKNKMLVCHVDNVIGTIELIVVAENSSHFNKHTDDYQPEDGSSYSTEDSDGNGIDDGCELSPSVACPCWDKTVLDNIDEFNLDVSFSCSYASDYPVSAQIYTSNFTGAFAAWSRNDGSTGCVDFDALSNYQPGITADEANACIDQIAVRCGLLGYSILQ